MQSLLDALADEPPGESALEVVTARMLCATELPKPHRQLEIAAFGATYRLDFAWPTERVALECDGRKWHEIESAFERDRQRWSAITAATGYRIVWATWRRLNNGPEPIVTALRELFAQCNQAAEPPSPRVRDLRRRDERSVGIEMTLSIDESTMVSRARRVRGVSSMAPTREDADG